MLPYLRNGQLSCIYVLHCLKSPQGVTGKHESPPSIKVSSIFDSINWILLFYVSFFVDSVLQSNSTFSARPRIWNVLVLFFVFDKFVTKYKNNVSYLYGYAHVDHYQLLSTHAIYRSLYRSVFPSWCEMSATEPKSKR